MENYVKSAQYFVLPPCELFIEMKVNIGDSQFKCIIQDNKNWIYDEREGRMKYAEPYSPIKEEKSIYRVTKEVMDIKTGETRNLMPIEQEMVLDFLFEKCGNEMKAIRKHEEEKMMYLLGMDENEYNSLSEEELKKLIQPYEFSEKN